VVLTGHGTMENAVQALRIGAYDFVVKPILDLAQLRISVARSLEKRRLQKLNHRYRRHLETMVGEQTERIIEQNRRLEGYALELETMSVSVISSLMTALEEKDGYTAGHSRRVTHYARAMAQELGLGPRLVWLVETAAALHDVGKLIVDVGFIKKKGPLSPEEWEIMRRHPVAADRFLAPFRFLDDVRPLIRRHHERLDGSGYPDGLGGPDLSLATQILAVADSYDAMTSRRSYRRTLKRGEAVTEMERVSGRHFKPEVIRALVAALDRLKAGSVME
jgi:HD-GYP domain-containing protein (c-di-GMP phosphodiesterase class II)